MANKSAIQWTDATWNIARGCTKVDEDCKYCYMYRDSMNGTRYQPLNVVKTKTVFDLPLKLKQPSKIFTCSLTDFFHEDIDEYREEAWEIIRQCPQHTFQILTKRPERILQCLPGDWGQGYNNVWLGASIGSENGMVRGKLLSVIPCKIKFLSLEPLHGPISLKQSTINIEILNEDFYILPAFDWVIVGGESGNENGKYKYRPCQLQWIEQIINDCKESRIPVFVKQLGTHLAKELKLKDRHGGNIDEFPENLKIREFPK